MDLEGGRIDMRSDQRFQFVKLFDRKGVSNLRQPFSEHPIQNCATSVAHRIARIKVFIEEPIETCVPCQAKACGHGLLGIASVNSARTIERMLTQLLGPSMKDGERSSSCDSSTTLAAAEIPETSLSRVAM